MPYKITIRQRNNARRLGYTIKPSEKKHKKIDVYTKDGKTKVASIGAMGYNDFSIYIRTKGLKYAKTRKALYLQRHQHEPKRKADGTPTASLFSDEILWA